MPTPAPIGTVEEFYAHALAIEREAAERYAEFEGYFRDRGEEVLAGLCGNLSRMEDEHFHQLAEASHTLDLPPMMPGDHQWLESGSPEAAARELFYRVATPRQLLEVALLAECSALAFFEWTCHGTADPEVRALARDMACDELQHVRWVRNALNYHPSSQVDWERMIAHGTGPGLLVGESEAPAGERSPPTD